MNFKKYIYLLCCFFLFSGARAYSVEISTETKENNISLDLNNVEIIKVLNILEEKTKYTFVFDLLLMKY